MIDIHNRLHKIRNSKSIKDPLVAVAEEVASEIKFLCFDEFQGHRYC
jgi:predicted ATPase